MTSRHNCATCKKSYLTDNSWILCGPDNQTVLAYFCSEMCRIKFVNRLSVRAGEVGLKVSYEQQAETRQ